MRLRFVAGFICKIKPDTQVSVKCKPTEQKKIEIITKMSNITLLIARIMKTESYEKMITLQHLHDS